jgi:hypothetical protein
MIASQSRGFLEKIGLGLRLQLAQPLLMSLPQQRSFD